MYSRPALHEHVTCLMTNDVRRMTSAHCPLQKRTSHTDILLEVLVTCSPRKPHALL